MRNPSLWVDIRNLYQFSWYKLCKLIREFAINTITISSGPKTMRDGLKYEMFQTDFHVCARFRCQVISLQNGVMSTQNTHIYCMYKWKICTHINMWGNHLLSRFFWQVTCPKSSTKQILNADGKILTLRAWQRWNSIVYQHTDRFFKSNQVKLLEMIWNDLTCTDSSPKWYLPGASTVAVTKICALRGRFVTQIGISSRNPL